MSSALGSGLATPRVVAPRREPALQGLRRGRRLALRLDCRAPRRAAARAGDRDRARRPNRDWLAPRTPGAARLEPGAVIGRQRVEQAGVGGTRRAADRGEQLALRRGQRVATGVAFGQRAGRARAPRARLVATRSRPGSRAAWASKPTASAVNQGSSFTSLRRARARPESEPERSDRRRHCFHSTCRMGCRRAATAQPGLAPRARESRAARARARLEIVARAGQVGERSALRGVHRKSYEPPLVAWFLATRQGAPGGARRRLTRVTRFDDVLVQRALRRSGGDRRTQLFGHDADGLRGFLQRRRRIALRQSRDPRASRRPRGRA